MTSQNDKLTFKLPRAISVECSSVDGIINYKFFVNGVSAGREKDKSVLLIIRDLERKNVCPGIEFSDCFPDQIYFPQICPASKSGNSVIYK